MKNREKIAAILIAIDIVLFIGAGYYIGGTFMDSLKNVKLEWLKKPTMVTESFEAEERANINVVSKDPVKVEVAYATKAITGEKVMEERADTSDELPKMQYGYSEEDIELLKKTTYAEAGICSEQAQRGVAATILARAKEQNKTISEVVFARGQFNCAVANQIYLVTSQGNIIVTDEMANNEKTVSAVTEALQYGAGDEITSVIGGEPLFFYSPSAAISEAERNSRATISAQCDVDQMRFYRVWN